MLTTTEQQIAKSITNVRMFVLIWRIFEPFMASTHSNTLEVVTTS
jgi:hypothetical protein